MEPIISVRGLGKSYRIQTGERKPYRTFRDDIADFGKGLLKGQWGNSLSEEFWALKDVSFDIMPGEVVGVIGRNGAGKSTLLKILSRIIQPTMGEASLKGRVAPLLEVGTGFHPELTGRENIYMSGAVLGMKQNEIRSRFDEIIEFAEVEKFLDTPVKRYSSGMYVRLAFAVAAHLEVEILLVDEILAVGDSRFQKKCLGKMKNVSKEGRTVLFVSHNMAAVRALCSRALLMRNSCLVADHNVEFIVEAYLSDGEASESLIVWNSQDAPRCSEIRFIRAYILNNKNEYVSSLSCQEKFSIVIEYEVKKPTLGLRIGFFMQNTENVPICGSTDFSSETEKIKDPGFYISHCTFPEHILNTGVYSVYFGADKSPYIENLIQTPICLTFTIEDLEGHGINNQKLPGVIRPKLDWKISKIRDSHIENL
jgi:lipopolysaccharide transport system ATP-binding protein